MNVLLTAAGRRAYLVDYFRQVVNPLGGSVCVTNTTPDATAYLAADRAATVSPSSSPHYIDDLIELCKKWEIKLLFSLHDWDAPVIARNRDKFLAVGTIPVMASAEVLATCLDKYKTVQTALQLGINVPKTYISLKDVKCALQEGQLTYPLIIKPRWGQGSLGIFKVESEDELEWGYYFSKKTADRFAAACQEIDASEPQVLIQECIEGEEHGCDIINDLNGTYRKAFVKHKFGMRSGETDAAETVENMEIVRQAERIAQWSKHLGCMDSDFIVNKRGVPYLIELNPRFGGGYPFTYCAGANVPLACVTWAQGKDDLENDWSKDYQIGIKTFKDIALKTLS